MRAASLVLGVLVVSIACAAACAEGDSPGFQGVGGGGTGSGGAGQGGDGDDDDDDDDDDDTSSNTSGQASGSTTVGATGSTTGVTTGGSTGSTTSVTSSASTGSGGAPPCQDTGLGEPANDQMTTAYFLGDQSDNDSDERTVMGVLQTPTDVDWYVYHGVDNAGSTVDPGRQILGSGIRLCKYIDCDDEDEEDFECPSGTQPDEQGGHRGCCWTSGEMIEWGLTCGSSSINSDNAKVYIRIDHEGGPGCESYTVKFNY